MSNDKHYEDPFTDPFDDQVQQDPFVDDHFTHTPAGNAHSGHAENVADATAILVLGILSILGSFCYGIPGLILGIIAVAMAGKPTRLYRANPGRYTVSSFNNMQAGKICGIIGICLSALVLLITIIAVVVVIADEPSFRY
jgi:hypothetical protein